MHLTAALCQGSDSWYTAAVSHIASLINRLLFAGPLSDGGDAAGDDMTDMADTAGLEWKAGRGGGGGGREKQKGGGQVSTVGDAGAGGPTTPEVCFGAGSAVGGCGCWCNSSSTSYEVLGCRPWYMIHVAEPVVTAHRVSR